jgi:hypothetical protein
VALPAGSSTAGAPGGSPGGGAAAGGGGDTSGTNPAAFTHELRLFNEFQNLPNGNSRNFFTLRYAMPLTDAADWNFKIDIPLTSVDINGQGEIGMGDALLNIGYRPIQSKKAATILQSKVYMDTASEDILGAGKWRLGLAVIEVLFPAPGVIFAPAYEHQFTIGGDSSRPDISVGAIDLYTVYAPGPEGYVMLDPTFVIDYENNNSVSSSVELELGHSMGGGTTFYVRPGVGLAGVIGSAEPYDWNLEIGIKKLWP